MRRERPRFTGVALGVVVVISVLAVAPATAQGQANQTFTVTQGGTCTQVTPLSNGTQSVVSFYDYEKYNPAANYSSLGTTDIQLDQTSQIFLYWGSDGLSLVFLNDKINEPDGFVATANISGLPVDGIWPVRDDDYDHADDVFDFTNTGAHIEWLSNGGRTDGAAFRGLRSPNYTTITIDMKFNEQSGNYPFKKWDSPPEQNKIEKWVVRSGTGETTELNMSQPVHLSPGTCRGGVSTFTATPGGANNTTTVGATGSTSSMTTATPSPTVTQSPTQTTQTPVGVILANQTANATSASEGTTQRTNGNGNGSSGSGSSGSGSGAFGPGFGVGLALVAVMALAAVALARRDD